MIAVLIGALLFSGVGLGAVAAGWWLPAAFVLAGVFAALTAWFVPQRNLAAEIVVLTALAVVLARTLGAYLAPAHTALVALVAVALAAAVAAFGGDVGVWTPRVLAALLVVAAVVFVLVSVAISPPVPVAAEGSPWRGIVAAGGLVAMFTVLDPPARRSRMSPAGIGAGALLAAAVSAAAVSQLGGVRLGLSTAPLADALAAADAATLDTLLDAVVLLVTLPALVAVFAGIHRREIHNGHPAWTTAGCAIVAAGGALFVDARMALVVASAVSIAAAVFGWIRARVSA